MKVCIVSLNIVPLFNGDRGRFYGGAEVQAVFVADALQACGPHVSLVVADSATSEPVPYPFENAFNSDDGVPGLRFFHPRWTGVMGALERADADVYYQRNAGMVTGLVGRFCRKHGKVFVYGAGSDVDFSLREVAIGNLRDKWLHRYGLNACDGIVAQNRVQAASATAFDKPVRVIPNGVRPVDAIVHDAGGAIVWMGAMWRVKRPELFLELASRMPEQRFQLVGAGGEQAERVRAAAAGLSNVEMLGRLNRSQVSDVLRRAALLVNTSSVEGFPNAFLEAWNHGLPVVTFNDVDGIIGETGVGAVCSGLDDMAAAIRDFAGDAARIALVRDRARRLIRERFSPEVIGPQYVAFFEELLRSNASRRDAVSARSN